MAVLIFTSIRFSLKYLYLRSLLLFLQAPGCPILAPKKRPFEKTQQEEGGEKN
jgi:hypothetical protein